MSNARVLTVNEVAALTARLAGRPCSPRQVRYLLISGGLGTDVQTRPRGGTRLYGVLDVALVRLALAIESGGVSAWLTRVSLTYLRDDVVRAWKSAASLAFVLRGIQARLEPVAKGRPSRAVVWVPLREIWRGLDAEVQQVSNARNSVWMYRPVAVHAVPRATTGE